MRLVTSQASREDWLLHAELITGLFHRKRSIPAWYDIPVLPAETNLLGPILPFPDHFRPEDISQEAPDSTCLNQVTLSDDEDQCQVSVGERLVLETDVWCYLPGPALEFVGLSRRLVTNY